MSHPLSLPRSPSTDPVIYLDCDAEDVVRIDAGPFLVARGPAAAAAAAASVDNAVCVKIAAREWLYLRRGAQLHELDVPGWGPTPGCIIGGVATAASLPRVVGDGAPGPDPAGAGLRRASSLTATSRSSAATLAAIDAANRRYLSYIIATGVRRPDGGPRIAAARAVAGGGKTTALLNAMKGSPKSRRFVVTAFNREMAKAMREKVLEWGLERNAEVSTFDALVRRAYIERFGECDLTDLKASTIGNFINCFAADNNAKYNIFTVRKAYCERFSAFCSSMHATPEAFCAAEGYTKGESILRELWDLALRGRLLTFDVLRKRAVAEDWFDPFLASRADAVLCDEAQDLDPGMISLLNRSRCQVVVYVGDPRQGIYGFRNAVDAFQHLPSGSETLELYHTFRVASPAVEIIARDTGAPMAYAGPERKTFLTRGAAVPWGENDEYVYLFRGWKTLLITARDTPGIKIVGYSEERISGFAKTRTGSGGARAGGAGPKPDSDEGEDLPSFVRSLGPGALSRLVDDIRGNWAEDAPRVLMSTVHSYKGLQAARVRLGVDVSRKKDNLYYVALTRGFEQIHVDGDNNDNDAPVFSGYICNTK